MRSITARSRPVSLIVRRPLNQRSAFFRSSPWISTNWDWVLWQWWPSSFSTRILPPGLRVPRARLIMSLLVSTEGFILDIFLALVLGWPQVTSLVWRVWKLVIATLAFSTGRV